MERYYTGVAQNLQSHAIFCIRAHAVTVVAAYYGHTLQEAKAALQVRIGVNNVGRTGRELTRRASVKSAIELTLTIVLFIIKQC